MDLERIAKAERMSNDVRHMCEALDLVEQREQEANEAEEKAQDALLHLVTTCGWEKRPRRSGGGLVSGEEWHNEVMDETVETMFEAVERSRSWVRFLREWTR